MPRKSSKILENFLWARHLLQATISAFMVLMIETPSMEILKTVLWYTFVLMVDVATRF